MHTSVFITCSMVAIEMVPTQTGDLYFVIYGLPDTQDANIRRKTIYQLEANA